MRRTIIAVALLAAVTLTGCAQMRQTVANYINSECQSMGLPFSTNEFAQCRTMLMARRDRQFNEGLDDIARGLSNRRSTTVDVYVH